MRMKGLGSFRKKSVDLSNSLLNDFVITKLEWMPDGNSISSLKNSNSNTTITLASKVLLTLMVNGNKTAMLSGSNITANDRVNSSELRRHLLILTQSLLRPIKH